MITDESILIIAEKLGISVNHIYDIFVTAQPVVAMIHIICGIIVIMCIVTGYILTKKYNNDDDEFPTVVGGAIGGMLGLILYMFSYYLLRCILLPEYAAIIKLMNLMTGSI